MVATRRSKLSSADLPQWKKPRNPRNTENTATSLMILDPSAKDSGAAIANDSAAQSSQEPLGLQEPHSDGYEHTNTSEPDVTNQILDADVDADGESVNENSASNDNGQDTTNIENISSSPEKQGLIPSDGRHLSKAQRPANLRKPHKTKESSSVKHTLEADSTPAFLSPSAKPYRVSKKSKSPRQPKRSATNHETASRGGSEKNQYKRCKKNALRAQIDRENFWMNCSMDYMMDALKVTDALSKLCEEIGAISKKRRNELEGNLEQQRKMIKDQGDILEDGINYIILCGARELKVTRRWGGV